MKLYLDSANLKDIDECARSGVVSGVTVNQSLLAKEPKCDPLVHLVEIDTTIAATERCWADLFSLSIPMIGSTPEEMIAFHRKTVEVGLTRVLRKVPMSWANLAVFDALRSDEDRCINATCIFSVYQADLAIRAGASIVSAFVGRMNDVQPDYGYRVLAAIKKRHPDTILLAGSVRNEEMVAKCEEAGADVVTVPRNVLEAMATDPHSDQSARKFNIDFEAWQNG